jgi:pimeloyl-ACP methyl ester carboxylesterase
MIVTPQTVERRFVATRSGRIHIAASGSGFPVLLLHQTPRSWDEFRDVLPLLGRQYHTIAMDTVGFGDSDPLPFEENSIEAWAAAAHHLLDALGLLHCAIAGHHTGAVVAIEMAAQKADRVAALVLSASPYVDAARRTAHAGKPVTDEVERRSDGQHLLDLWTRRQPNYPQADIELLERFVADALRAGDLAAEGHRVVYRYRMEDRLPLVRCPTLVIAPKADPHAYPSAAKVAKAIAGSRLIEIDNAMVPFPDQMPEIFARTVEDFLSQIGRDELERRQSF